MWDILKKKNKIKINIKPNNELNLSEFIIEFKSKSQKILDKVEKIETLQKIKLEKKHKIKKNLKTQKQDHKKRKFVHHPL